MDAYEKYFKEVLKNLQGRDFSTRSQSVRSTFEKYQKWIILAGASSAFVYFFIEYLQRKEFQKRREEQERKKEEEYQLDLRNPLRHMEIVEISSIQEMVRFDMSLYQKINGPSGLQAMGFDCEWETDYSNNKRRPISLLQIATADGTCGLYRLSKLRRLPTDLEMILRDHDVIKLGVGPLSDAEYLRDDFGIRVRGCVDLRYLFPDHGEGLATLSENILGVKLDKRLSLRCSKWEKFLNKEQLEYAAKDALVAMEMFKRWLLMQPGAGFAATSNRDYRWAMNNLMGEILSYVDVPFDRKKLKRFPY